MARMLYSDGEDDNELRHMLQQHGSILGGAGADIVREISLNDNYCEARKWLMAQRKLSSKTSRFRHA